MSEAPKPSSGQEPNRVSLVRRATSALEGAAPGARRIMAAMVADALEPAKKASAQRAVLPVLTCTGQQAFSDAIQTIVAERLADKRNVIVNDRWVSTDIIEFVQRQPVAFIVALLNNILVPNAAGPDERILRAVEVLGSLKKQHHVPVIALSFYMPTTFDLAEASQLNGIDAFLPGPFQIAEFLRAFDRCLT